ncbi:MAG: S8 family serine peptidase, partial [Symploca sp. SIO2G7]|nr:S8 family serine peptidase [Symploca sp. SIO2G7]
MTSTSEESLQSTGTLPVVLSATNADEFTPHLTLAYDSFFTGEETTNLTYRQSLVEQMELLPALEALSTSNIQAISDSFPSDAGETDLFKRSQLHRESNFPGTANSSSTIQSQSFTPNDPLFANQWHLQNTGQSVFGYVGTPGEDANVVPVWNQGITGSGVVIGIVDHGVQGNHPDLISNYRADLSYDFWDNDNDPSPTTFGESHGTSVAGVAAGRGGNGIGISGAAPNASVASLRFFSETNYSLADNYVANVLSHQQNQIDIYNNSWGPPWNPNIGTGLAGPGPLTTAALQNGVTNGRNGLGNIYVFAAGNGLQDGDNVNYNGYTNSRYTIAVGAIDSHGVQTDYSTPGAALLVSAHSGGTRGIHAGITTTDQLGSAGYNPINNGYDGNGDYTNLDYTNSFNGTSSSAPLVSGVIALMLEADANDSNGANLTWRDVQHILVESARQNDVTDSDWQINGAGYNINHKYGFGAVDAAAAVNLAQDWTSVGPEISSTSGLINISQFIPDNNPFGIASTFTTNNDIDVEWVEVVLDADHNDWGDLELILTSPDGTESILAEEHLAPNNNYNSWQFTSARHWGESSLGDWTLRVSDEDAQNIGIWNSWQLNFYGTANNTQLPDLVGRNFDILQEPLNAGDSFSVDFTLQNSGDIAAGAFNVSFYLSTDNNITSSDYLLDTASVSGLSDLSFVNLTQNLTLPGVNNSFWNGDGTYFVGMIVDSGGTVTESNENNNSNVGLLLDYDNVVVSVDDAYEENDTIATAYDLSNQEQTWLSNIAGLGLQADQDWYRIDVTQGYENLVVDLQFDHALGDLDLFVYDAAGNFVTSSTSTTDNESINTILPSSGTYYLAVDGYPGDTLNTYDLRWDDVLVDDSYEENDTIATAYDLSNQEQTWLSDIAGLGLQADQDWYRIDVTPGYENLVVDLQFNHALGNLDLFVYDAAGNFVTSSTSTTDNESINTILPSSGTYYLAVDGYPGDTLNTYDLRWDDVLVDDSYEENDTIATAYDLSNQEQTWLSDIAGLGLQADQDWYRVDVTPGYENLEVDLQFNHALGNLDLFVYDAAGNFVTSSTSTTDNESINTILPGSGTYYLAVDGYPGDTLNTYDLRWDDVLVDDSYEENDTIATAYDLGNQEQTWLSNIAGLGLQADQDWYRIDVTPGYENLVVDLQFNHALGDLDLEVYDAAGNFVTSSNSTTDNESINTLLPGSGTYYLLVDGYPGNTLNTYDLSWD